MLEVFVILRPGALPDEWQAQLEYLQVAIGYSLTKTMSAPIRPEEVDIVTIRPMATDPARTCDVDIRVLVTWPTATEAALDYATEMIRDRMRPYMQRHQLRCGIGITPRQLIGYAEIIPERAPTRARRPGADGGLFDNYAKQIVDGTNVARPDS